MSAPAWGSRLVYGGDYNPEQWPREVWDEDIRLMREAKVNTVTVGVFAWSSIEPREGEYAFEWLDEVMDLMAANGIHVILATPTASPPPWFTLAHPEGLPVTKDGVRLIHGSRDTYNPAAPAYREAAKRIARVIGERYASHPALAMWHVHNEYGSVSYGPETDAAFRIWLRGTYGDLETLNRIWNTAFWSQGYGSWDEIFAPQATQYLPNPAQVVDFKRFTADTLRDCLREQVEILREIDPGVPVTTNFMLPTWNHYDQWDFAELVDQVSIDHYLDDAGIDGDTHVAFGADLARSFNGGRPWLLMEQATSLIYDYAGGRMYAKEPGRMLRNTLQYLARGSTGSLFFQWRSPRVGAEFFHSAMVPHVGEDSRIFREISQLGDVLDRLGELADAPAHGPVNRNRIAIVWDADAWWASETRAMPSGDLRFLPAVRGVHTALWRLGINADVVNPDADVSAYGLVLVPSMIAVSDAQSERFAEFVANGGHLAVWYFSGTTDEHLNVRPGSYSAAFVDALGIRVEEHFPQSSDAVMVLDDGSHARNWLEHIELRGAEAVASLAVGPNGTVQGGLREGSPVVTRFEYGSGRAHYVATELSDASLQRHLARMADEAGVGRDHPQAGGGLEIVRRFAGERSYLFVLNHTAHEHDVEVDGVELLSGSETSNRVRVEPWGSAIVRETVRQPEVDRSR